MNKKIFCRILSLVTLFVLILSSFSEAFDVSRTSTGAIIKWFKNNTVYYVNPSGGPYGSVLACQNAMQTWTNAPANFSFIYGGTTTNTAHGTLDFYNMIDFGSLPQGTVGESAIWFYTHTGEIVDSDTRLNTSYYLWAIDGSADSCDVESIVLHELGHSLQLCDLYPPADAEKVMYGYYSKGQIRRSLHQDDIDGIVFIYGGVSGYSPVYRFWSGQYGHHFYTISEAEKNYVIATWPSIWAYEGAVFYAFTTQVPGTSPVYRFFSPVYSGHFYTISEAEKNYVIDTWPTVWTYEGAVYYAYPIH